MDDTVACNRVVCGRSRYVSLFRLATLASMVCLAWSVALTKQTAGAADEPTVIGGVFGPESHGLRCRMVAVSPTSDDESPDGTKSIREFARGADLTFAVELKNVSNQPVTLLGVRYSDSYPTAKGNLNTSFLGPRLFDFQFSDEAGKPIARAERVVAHDMMALHGASAHDVAPGDSLTVLLRPAQFLAPLDYQLSSGRYRATIRYHGPGESVRTEIAKHWPDSPQAKAWSHDVTSGAVDFSIAEDPNAAKPPSLIWGPVKDGLQAAIEYRTPKYVLESPTEPPGVPLQTNLQVIFHVKNVGPKPITFVSETSRQGDNAHVTDAAGKEVKVSSPFFTGWPIDVRWNLKTGEIAKLQVLSPGVNSIKEPGEYMVRYEIRFNSRRSTDKDGNQTFPLKGDWQDVLETAETPLFLRPRTRDDDERAKPPSFFGKVEFVTEQGDPIESGSFTYRGEIQQKYHKNRLLKAGPIDIPECTTRPAMVYVRADGYEEASFHNVKFAADKTTVLKLEPAATTRFRLMSTVDSSPIANAKIRYFNKTSAKASSGPFPMDGIEGPVWATSDDDGQVILTTLQRVNPLYEDLGDAAYYFYIEPANADLAPRFVGPVKAGQDLGNVKLGGFLEVRGQVRGTPQELERFSAEWDQPFEQTSENPDATWLYAVSQRLQTQVDGDKLTFLIPRLRTGKLRIISSFAPRPHSVSHTYGRRDAKGSDVLVEVDLTAPSTEIVITPQGLGPANDEMRESERR